MKRVLIWLAAAFGSLLLICAAAFGLFWVAAMSGPWSLHSKYDGEFAELPASDRPLEEAIERVEGVISGSAQVARSSDGRRVRIGFGTGGDMWNRPPLPDLERLCREHGYKGQVGDFRPADSADQPLR